MMNHAQKSRSVIAAISLCLCLLIFTLVTPHAEALTALTASLDIGSRGTDVTNLQTFLAQDTTIYPGQQITGYYGTLTAAAVKRFQTRYGISAVGRVGPQTRAKINELIASGGLGTGTATGPNKAPAIYGLTTALSNTSGTSSLVVSWQTDEAARGRLFYGTSPFTLTESNSPTAEPGIGGVANIMTDDTYTTTKSISVNNLWPSGVTSNYYYMVESIDANGNISVTWPRIVNSSGVSSQ